MRKTYLVYELIDLGKVRSQSFEIKEKDKRKAKKAIQSFLFDSFATVRIPTERWQYWAFALYAARNKHF